jgi:hypothetical protein
MRCPNHVTLGCSFSCPTFWELNGSILPLVVGFFGKSFTRARVCFPSSRCLFGYHAITSLLMCGFKGKCFVINFSYHSNILFIIGPLSYNIMYLFWFATSYSDPPFIVSMWSHHWQFRCPFGLVPMWEWTYSSPWHILRYYCSYYFKEWNTCSKGGLPPFPLPHLTMGFPIPPHCKPEMCLFN